MENVKDKIHALVLRYGGTFGKFADMIGVSTETVRTWVKRDGIPDKSIHLLLDNLPNLNPKWLFEDEEPMCFDRFNRPHYRGVNASCGYGNDSNPDMTDLGVISTNIAGIEAFINADGDSMSPEIEDEDILGIAPLDPFELPNTDDIYLFITYDGDRYVKRLEESNPKGETLKLLSANKAYKPIYIDKQDLYRIYKVVSIGKKVKKK